ncbi:MAG: aminoacetone oxidase family FAD-binding enzyme [Bacilli bacterium]|nr:aminoacetone oxidase family FAD-binding enzyme [Bacilli bacterium]
MPRVAIIGGGASGLLCAIHLKEILGDKVDVTVFERNNRLGKKISLSGNGRGNISNNNVNKTAYNNPTFVEPTLAKYGASNLCTYFQTLGLLTRADEEGRIYPYNEVSNSVLDVLRLALNNQKIPVVYEYVDFIKKGPEFAVGIRRFDYVVCAIGSIASNNEHQNKLATSLEELGHHFTKLIPALAPLPSTNPCLPSLVGVRVKAKGSIFIKDKKVMEESGEFIFKDHAISGIALFNLTSRFALELQKQDVKNARVSLDLFPEYSEAELTTLIKTQIKNQPSESLAEILTGFVQKMVALSVVKEVGKIMLSSPNNDKVLELVRILKGWDFIVTPPKDTSNAQVISGGIKTNEVNANTLESELVPNLYFGGEVLDVNGICGGYNLHFAFASGLVMAESIARKIEGK